MGTRPSQLEYHKGNAASQPRRFKRRVLQTTPRRIFINGAMFTGTWAGMTDEEVKQMLNKKLFTLPDISTDEGAIAANIMGNIKGQPLKYFGNRDIT